MKYFFLLCLLQLILASAVLSAPSSDEEEPKEDSLEDDKRIVRAKNPDKAYPYYVLMMIETPGKKGEFLCGGTIIADNWVITAAHCVTRKLTKGDPKAITMYHGTTSLKKGTVRKGCLIIPHPKFKSSDPYVGYDIALIKIPTKIEDSKFAKLPETDDENTNYGGKMGLSMGFGRTEWAGFTATLRHAELPIANPEDCFQEHQRENKRIICVNIAEKAPSVCTGDSGGPLVDNSTDTLWGIVSYGQSIVRQCEDYNVFTKVAAHLDWIKETMEANKGPC